MSTLDELLDDLAPSRQIRALDPGWDARGDDEYSQWAALRAAVRRDDDLHFVLPAGTDPEAAMFVACQV